jgi:hypothetical protein
MCAFGHVSRLSSRSVRYLGVYGNSGRSRQRPSWSGFAIPPSVSARRTDASQSLHRAGSVHMYIARS